jgi:chromosome segregation protein
MTAQLDGLKKQARQAQRYRRLAEQIRRTEAQLLLARWAAATAEAERLAAELRAAERDVAAASETAIAAERDRNEAEIALPDLRGTEASASAELQRLNQAARAVLEQELSRIAAAARSGPAARRSARIST